LAERFNEEAAVNPDLTIEEFAIRYGVQAELIQRFAVKRTNAINVWHGTTLDRAKSIIEEGFRARGSRGKRIWFTMKPFEAHSIAKHRAHQREEGPVVFRCEINLDKYSEFDRPNPNHYAFKHSHITNETIRSVSGMRKDKDEARRLKEEKRRQELVDVMITQTSGRLGILHWINSYLKMKGEQAVSEDHPAIEAIEEWVEAQYATGRDASISDEEMLSQVMKHFTLESEE